METAEEYGLAGSHRVVLLILSVALLCLVLELVRRGLLKERYALLWLAAAAFGLVVGVFPQTILFVSRVFHLQRLTVLFTLTFLFLLGLVLSFSVVISRLAERNRELSQEVALLGHELEQLKKKNSA